jgi:hypothetical protein
MESNNNLNRKQMSRKKKYAFYTLGLGLVLLGATQLSPAQNAIEKTDQENVTDTTPAQARTDSMQNSSQRKQAINSLSNKNKAAFHTLSEADQKKVVDAHKSGKGAQSGLNDVLNEDAKSNDKGDGAGASSTNQNSPASKSMKKNQQDIYD